MTTRTWEHEKKIKGDDGGKAKGRRQTEGRKEKETQEREQHQ